MRLPLSIDVISRNKIPYDLIDIGAIYIDVKPPMRAIYNFVMCNGYIVVTARIDVVLDVLTIAGKICDGWCGADVVVVGPEVNGFLHGHHIAETLIAKAIIGTSSVICAIENKHGGGVRSRAMVWCDCVH